MAEFTTPLAALIGALAAFFVTMALAEAAGGRSINFVLSGIVIGIAISSFTTILIVSSDDARLHGALSWLFGSFAFISWTEALLIIIPVLLLSFIILMYARELNVILLGDERARRLGLDVTVFKRMTVLVVSVLTAVSVAFCGLIAFLGLIVPHTARMIVGGDHGSSPNLDGPRGERTIGGGHLCPCGGPVPTSCPSARSYRSSGRRSSYIS